MGNGNYKRTEQHNKKISDVKKKYYSDPKNREKCSNTHKGVKNQKYSDFSQEVIKKKGVLIYRFECVDCGAYHYTQKIKGQPKCPRCHHCAAKKRSTGRIFTQETKNKISKSLKGHPVADKCKKSEWLHTPEVVEKARLKKIGRPAHNKGKKVTNPETLRKQSEDGKRRWADPEKRKAWGKRLVQDVKDGKRKTKKGQHLSIEQIQQLASLPNKLKNYNKSEQYLDGLIQKYLPDQYKYNGGAQLGFRIRWHVPDFVNVNGQKKIIEFNGCVWHCCPECGIEKHPMKKDFNMVREKDKRQIREAGDLGYKVLTIWEHELGDEQAIINKLVEFNNQH